MEEKTLKRYKAIIKVDTPLSIGGIKSVLQDFGFMSESFNPNLTREIVIEARTALEAKLLLENKYGLNCCANFPKEIIDKNSKNPI